MANRQTNMILFYGDAVTDVSTTQKYVLGTKREEEGQTYRYVQRNDATVTIAAGDLVYRGSTQATFWEITGDVSDCDSAFAAGVAQGAIADAGFGWIKTKGYEATLKKLNGTAAYSLLKGDALIAAHSSTSDGKVQRAVIAASTKVSAAELRKVMERVIGFAAAAATNSAVAVAAYIDLE